MKLNAAIFAAFLVSGTVAMAQENIVTPRVEVGMNYEYERINPGSGYSSYNTNGGFSDIEYNLTQHLGVVADLGLNYIGTANGLNFHNTTFEYLFGPRINLHHGHFNPFIETLFGAERFSNGWNPGAFTPFTGVAQTNFTMAFGGGLDLAISNHFSIRPVEADYMVTEFSPVRTNFVQNNLRLAAGVVFRLGSK